MLNIRSVRPNQSITFRKGLVSNAPIQQGTVADDQKISFLVRTRKLPPHNPLLDTEKNHKRNTQARTIWSFSLKLHIYLTVRHQNINKDRKRNDYATRLMFDLRSVSIQNMRFSKHDAEI